MLAVPSAIPRMPSHLHCQTQACAASSVRFAWDCIVGRREGGLLTAGPVANMNLTRLNSKSGLYEHTRPPTKADLAVHMQAEAQEQHRPDVVRPTMAVRPSRPRHQSMPSSLFPLPSDHHRQQRRRLSLVDFTSPRGRFSLGCDVIALDTVS